MNYPQILHKQERIETPAELFDSNTLIRRSWAADIYSVDPFAMNSVKQSAPKCNKVYTQFGN